MKICTGMSLSSAKTLLNTSDDSISRTSNVRVRTTKKNQMPTAQTLWIFEFWTNLASQQVNILCADRGKSTHRHILPSCWWCRGSPHSFHSLYPGLTWSYGCGTCVSVQVVVSWLAVTTLLLSGQQKEANQGFSINCWILDGYAHILFYIV